MEKPMHRDAPGYPSESRRPLAEAYERHSGHGFSKSAISRPGTRSNSAALKEMSDDLSLRVATQTVAELDSPRTFISVQISRTVFKELRRGQSVARNNYGSHRFVGLPQPKRKNQSFTDERMRAKYIFHLRGRHAIASYFDKPALSAHNINV